MGARGSAVGWGTALQVGRSRVRFLMVSLEFFIDTILPAALWPWGWLSLQHKWVPGIFPGGKGGRCVGLTTLPPSCADCLTSGSLNLLEPSGPLQACNGIALPSAVMAIIRSFFFHPGWRIRSQSSSSGIYSDQFSTGTCFFSKNVGFSCNYHVISRPYWCISNWGWACGWALGLLDIAVREDAVRLKKNASVLRGKSSFDLWLCVVWTNLPPTTPGTIILCLRIGLL